MALTPKQEKFCRKYVECGNASEAYRFAYNASKMKSKVINNKASDLLARGDIRVVIDNLQAKVIEKFEVTLEGHLADLAKLRDMAVKKEQYSAAITAEHHRGKAAGHYVDRSESIVKLEQSPREVLEARLQSLLHKGKVNKKSGSLETRH